MTKNKLPLILAAVVVLGLAGAFMTGMIGGKKEDGPARKFVVPPVTLAEPFTVNTADPSGNTYLVANIAVQLEPMSQTSWDNYSGANAGGHGGGSGEMPGAVQVSTYPKFRNAVIETAATMTAKELRASSGKAEFKKRLLEEFAQIAEVDEAEHKAAPEDPAHEGVAPPYHVMQIDFTQWAVQ